MVNQERGNFKGRRSLRKETKRIALEKQSMMVKMTVLPIDTYITRLGVT